MSEPQKRAPATSAATANSNAVAALLAGAHSLNGGSSGLTTAAMLSLMRNSTVANNTSANIGSTNRDINGSNGMKVQPAHQFSGISLPTAISNLQQHGSSTDQTSRAMSQPVVVMATPTAAIVDAKRLGRPKKRKPADDGAEQRRQRHREVEIRRRQKLARLFTQLGDFLGCSNSDKASILLEALTELQRKKATLINPELDGSPTVTSDTSSSGNGGGDSSESKDQAYGMDATAKRKQPYSTFAPLVSSEGLLTDMPALIFNVDNASMSWNRSFLGVVGMTETDMASQDLVSLIHASDATKLLRIIHQARCGEVVTFQLNVRLQNDIKKGVNREFTLNGSRLIGFGGRTKYVSTVWDTFTEPTKTATKKVKVDNPPSSS